VKSFLSHFLGQGFFTWGYLSHHIQIYMLLLNCFLVPSYWKILSHYLLVVVTNHNSIISTARSWRPLRKKTFFRFVLLPKKIFFTVTHLCEIISPDWPPEGHTSAPPPRGGSCVPALQCAFASGGGSAFLALLRWTNLGWDTWTFFVVFFCDDSDVGNRYAGRGVLGLPEQRATGWQVQVNMRCDRLVTRATPELHL